MKLRNLFLALLVMFAGVAMAQVEAGKVYRIVNAKYGTVITASPITQQLTCVDKGGDSDYPQMWKFEEANNGKFYIMNVYSGRYIQNESQTYQLFKTGNAKVAFSVKENTSIGGCYNIDANNRAGGWGMHCDGGGNVVPWSNGTGTVSATEWVFEQVSISELEITEAQKEYAEYNKVLSNREAVVALVNNMFKDKTGTELKAEYAKLSDEALVAAMENVPAELQQAILKVKNNSWATEERANLSEKNFRIYDYKPYSNPEQWKDILYHRPFNRINNPTGICTTSDKSFVYVFVDEIPEGTEVYLAEMNGTSYFGLDTELVEGLNIVPAANKDGVLYIRYICDTHTGFDVATKSGPKKLSDYPTLKVHIEGGYVNGFWSKERGHTNEDWVYMGKNMFHNEGAVQAVGDESMLNFRKKEFLQPYQYTDAWGFKVEGCPTDIETVMKFWDFWNERQRWYMNLDDYYDYFNNKQLAMSDDNGFMDAGNYRTHYNNNTLTTIVNIDRISRDGGSAWGPLHEIGHTNQYAFEIVGTSEVSNNALANFTIFDTGTHTSRGWNMDAQIADFEKNVPYVVRGEGDYGSELFSMTRMYFQLFLYFHAAGKHPEFYPTLFEELRKDKLVGWVTSSNRDLVEDENGFILGSMDATHDQLKFVEKCCSIAQMDLTEFFEAWGFFIPMKNAFVGDYGHHHVYLLQDSIDACKARIKKANYPKKGGHLMFLEDRIRLSKQKKSILNENPSGYRADYSSEAPVANNFCGLYGQWEDYIDESVKAQGYYYAVSDGKVTIIKAENAGGALGFKLYDKASGKLITYTNRESMKIPVPYLNSEFIVRAAQADGEDYEVPHASQGPESMQRNALEKSLSTAKKYTWRKATAGNEIGYFYPAEVAYLTEIYNAAKNAFDKYDTSERSYAEWSVMLDNECKRLVTTEGTRVMFEEGMTVKIHSVKKNGALLTSTYSGVVAHSNTTQVTTEKQWSIEYAGEADTYYLRNGDGNYIADFTTEFVYADATDTKDAAKFVIEYTEDGSIYFTKKDGEGVIALGVSTHNLTVDGKNYPAAYGMKMTDTSTQWYAYSITDKSKEFYKEALEDIVDESRFVITEVLNLDSIGTMNIFNSTIIVKDRNLEQYIVDLYNLYTTVVGDIDNEKMHKSYLNSFRELHNRINGTYIVKAPIATKDETIAWYRLKETSSSDYLSVGTSGTKKGRLILDGTENDYTLWAFAPTGRQNEYKVYNCKYEGYVAKKSATSSNLVTSMEDFVLPLTVVYDAGKNVITLNNGDNALGNSNKYVNAVAAAKAYTWTLELVALEDDAELAEIITIVESILEEGDREADCYDLSGRKVVNPTKGIYIQNGKKVFIK